jgi:hypothetical protein
MNNKIIFYYFKKILFTAGISELEILATFANVLQTFCKTAVEDLQRFYVAEVETILCFLYIAYLSEIQTFLLPR